MDASFGFVIYSPEHGYYEERLDLEEAKFSNNLDCRHFELIEQARANLEWIVTKYPDSFVMEHGVKRV